MCVNSIFLMALSVFSCATTPTPNYCGDMMFFTFFFFCCGHLDSSGPLLRDPFWLCEKPPLGAIWALRIALHTSSIVGGCALDWSVSTVWAGSNHQGRLTLGV